MKKKAVVAMLVMCMALSAAACGEKKTSESTGKTAESSAEEKSTESQSQKKASVRLVSVEDTSKYITVGTYKGLQLEKVVAPVSDTEVEAEIRYRMENSAVEAKDGAVEMGDQIRINFNGTIDGEEFEGGTEEDFDMTVGEGGIAEGFDEGLIGMKKGETREISIAFPEDYYDSELAGKTASYQVMLQWIKRVPELTDEWAASNTESKTAEEYKAAVRKELEDGADEAAELQLYSDAWYTVLESSEIKEYPQKDLDQAIQGYQDLNEKYLAQAQMDLDQFLEVQGISEEDYEEECRRYAEEKIKQNLIVQYIMDQEGLSLDEASVKELENQLLKQYGAADMEELKDTYGETAVNESLALLQVNQFIVQQGQVDQKVSGGDDLAANQDAYPEDGSEETDSDELVVEE